jgi:RimJ/RimL family protein N-acetyltransferase
MADEGRRPLLRSARLLLRPGERDDLATFVRWMNDARVQETLGARGPLGLLGEERWFEELQGELGKTRWHFVVCLRADERPIGFCGLDGLDATNGSAELGIGIGEPSEWDKGYGTEAMAILLDFGFGELRLHRIRLHVFAGNDRAIHVYEKVGFVHEGTEREAYYHHGGYRDLHLMGILRSEWARLERPRTWEIE